MEITLLEAADLINKAQVIAVPTETVYGLAASLFKPTAIDKIFSLKGRPANNPLIIHVADYMEVLPFLKNDNSDFIELAKAFWPGPLTIVMPIKIETVSARIRANLTTAAFRVPNHPLARELIKLTGPLVMPSANLSGRPSATSKEHVKTDFGQEFPVLNGGACEKGLESTIIYKNKDNNKWKIIRQGALAADDFRAVLGYIPEIEKPKSNETPVCPGQLYRHYAPKAKLKLTTEFKGDFDGVVVGFDEGVYPDSCTLYSLGSLKEPETISQNLYRILRKLDEDGINVALVDINIPNNGIFATILERLQKASS
jgi:L-threonylcarbamoyladenylate synthase